MNMYVIRDNVAHSAGPIYLAKNDAVASRMFRSIISEHGVDQLDYTLLFVGSYNDESQVVNASAPVPIEVPIVNMKVVKKIEEGEEDEAE